MKTSYGMRALATVAMLAASAARADEPTIRSHVMLRVLPYLGACPTSLPVLVGSDRIEGQLFGFSRVRFGRAIRPSQAVVHHNDTFTALTLQVPVEVPYRSCWAKGSAVTSEASFALAIRNGILTLTVTPRHEGRIVRFARQSVTDLELWFAPSF